MKILIAGLFLTMLNTVVCAEPHPRQIRVMCGSLEEVQMTMKQYGEHMVIATQAPNERTVNLLYVNFETQTSSWFVHDLETDEYCMVGVGKAIHIPTESPLKETPTGLKIVYN